MRHFIKLSNFSSTENDEMNFPLEKKKDIQKWEVPKKEKKLIQIPQGFFFSITSFPSCI